MGGGLLGTLGSGLAFFAAPGIGVGMGIGVITAILKVCFTSSWKWFITDGMLKSLAGVIAGITLEAVYGKDGKA